MKRASIILVLAIVFVAAYSWFERRESPVPAPAAATPAAEDPLLVERRSLFGEDALGADVKWRQSGLGYRIQEEGTPPKPGIGTPVRLKYVGKLKDGTVFDRSDTPVEFLIGGTIPGLSTGLQMLGRGGKATFYIPPSIAYGNRKVMGIPPGSGLIFEVEVTEIGAR